MTTTAAQVATALRRPTPATGSDEYAQWEMWIGDARMLIQDRLGDLAVLDQVKLDYVVREAVVAHVRRPDDATQVDIQIDDGRTSRTYASARGRVTITDDQWALLDPARAASGAFSVRPYAEPDRHPCTSPGW